MENSFFKRKIWRRIHFLKQNDIQRTFIVDILEFQENQMINLNKIFISLQNKGITYNQGLFIRTGTNQPINSKIQNFVIFEYFSMKDIYFQNINLRLQRNDTHQTQKQEQSQVKTNSNFLQKVQYLKFKSLQQIEQKKFRNKQPQRKLIDVIKKIKCWRMLNQIDNMNLREAAKIVGVSKKTLDDYFLILRNTEKYGFDFQKNLQNGVGKVRAYIKKCNPRKEGRLPNQISSYNFFNIVKDQFLLNSSNDQIDDSLCCYKIDHSQDE